MNISNFITWFVQQFINIGANLLGKLDMILLTNNVSLLDFIITIMILGAFISIVVSIPNGSIVNRTIAEKNNAERRAARNSKAKTRKG